MVTAGKVGVADHREQEGLVHAPGPVGGEQGQHVAPPVPSAGLPEMVAVPLPLSFRLMP